MAGAVLKGQPTRAKAKQAGIGGYLWIASLEEFNVLQKPLPTGTGTTAGDEATITGNHTFKTNAGTTTNGFIKFPLVPTKSGKWEMKTEGDYPSEKVVSSFEVMATGINAVQLEMIKRIKGYNLIALIQDAECDDETIYQIGCDCKPVDSIKVEFSSEDNILKLSGKAECVANEYAGTITLMAP